MTTPPALDAPPAAAVAHRPGTGSRLVLAAAAVAVVTVVVGLVGRLEYGAFGTVTAPFVSGWLPDVDLRGLAVAIAGCVLLVVGGTWLVTARLRPWQVSVLLYGLALAGGLALNLARDWTHGWTEIYDLAGGTAQGHAINEYLPGLPTLEDGISNYLDRFAEVVPSQTVNVAGHPPGPLLLAHLFGVTTADGLARLVILIGTACAPLAHRIGWTLSGDERAGRVAGVLCASSPLTLLFGVTSFDYAFAAIAAGAAAGLIARRRSLRLLGFVLLAIASLMSWALLAVGAWAVVMAWRRDGFVAAVRLGVGCGVAVLLLQGFLVVAYGYDPIATLRATEQVYRDSLARVRPYAFWVFGSPVAWGLMLGPLIVAGALRSARVGTAAGLAIVAIVVVASIGGFSKAETERIWLPFVPFACAAAATHLRAPCWLVETVGRFTNRSGQRPVSPATAEANDDRPAGVAGTTGVVPGPSTVAAVLATLVTQALIWQLLFNTVW